MKKKFLTVMSATCAVLALTSCGGSSNTGKHPKITLYGIESLTLMQNGKELASAADISASFGKDFELTFKPNNRFAAIKRWTDCGYKYAQVVDQIQSYIMKEEIKVWKWVECDPSETELASPGIATPYVGYGNYIYPNDYALARDYAYTYKLNDDGSATLKVKGEYFQKNLVISFDRGVTGDNDYCVPVQQLGLDDVISASELEIKSNPYGSWCNEIVDSNDDNYIHRYSTSYEGNKDDSWEKVLEVEESELSTRKYDKGGYTDGDKAVINDSLIAKNASIKFSLSGTDVPDYLYSNPTFEVIGYKTWDGEKSADPVTLKLGENITHNDAGDYFVNIPFVNAGKDEAILETCEVTKEHPYGFKLKYEGGITIIPKVTSVLTDNAGIVVNFKDSKERSSNGDQNVDFDACSFIGKDYKLYGGFSVYCYDSDGDDYVAVDSDGEIKNFIPTVKVTLSGGTPIVLDASDTSNCTLSEWEVSEQSSTTGEDFVYHFYSVTNNNATGWQLTVRYKESEKSKAVAQKDRFNYWFNPISTDSLKNSEGKWHNSIKVEIEFK